MFTSVQSKMMENLPRVAQNESRKCKELNYRHQSYLVFEDLPVGLFPISTYRST